jgi:hypothetical protein
MKVALTKAYLDQFDPLSFVIAGLVPAIPIIRHRCAFLSEMAGTSPAKTS